VSLLRLLERLYWPKPVSSETVKHSLFRPITSHQHTQTFRNLLLLKQ